METGSPILTVRNVQQRERSRLNSWKKKFSRSFWSTTVFSVGKMFSIFILWHSRGDYATKFRNRSVLDVPSLSFTGRKNQNSQRTSREEGFIVLLYSLLKSISIKWILRVINFFKNLRVFLKKKSNTLELHKIVPVMQKKTDVLRINNIKKQSCIFFLKTLFFALKKG